MTEACVEALQAAGLGALPQLLDAYARGGEARRAAEAILRRELGAEAAEAGKVGGGAA